MSAVEPEVRAAGGVVFRVRKRPEVLLIHRPRYRDWSFPKGKVDPGERWRDGAWREVWEETGLECTLLDRIAVIAYLDAQGRAKEVRYWAMEPDGKIPKESAFEPNAEVDRVRWLELGDARAQLSYRRDREVLDAFCRWWKKR